MANLLSSLPAFLPVAWMLFHAPGHAMFPAGSTSVPTAFARTACVNDDPTVMAALARRVIEAV